MGKSISIPAVWRDDPKRSAGSALQLRGAAASRGVYIGRARVVRSTRDLTRLRPGDVLVCRAMSASWASFFKTIGAVVADDGGTLCNAASIAREYRLPAVVATKNATSRICDGSRVEVNGDNGIVTVVRMPDEKPLV